MSLKHIGETLDIHGGGLDLMFPHHENELAQSECCTGKKFTKYWLHNGLMQAGKGTGKVGGAHSRHGDKPEEEDLLASKESQEATKLGKSSGAASVKELFAKHAPETVRFFLLSTHYRSPIDFSDENIAETGKSLEGFHRLIEAYARVSGQDFYTLPTAPAATTSSQPAVANVAFAEQLAGLRQRFLDAMDDDFNTGGRSASSTTFAKPSTASSRTRNSSPTIRATPRCSPPSPAACRS